VVPYGLEAGAEIRGTDVELGSFGGRCVVHRHRRSGDERLGVLELVVPGRHNLQNALGTVAVGLQIGLDFERISQALREFQGAERRFERRGEQGGVLVVDDYGHHPTEIAAVLAAARVTLNRRIVVALQPHRYTRTKELLEAFGPSLAAADEIVLTDIYSAGEPPIPGLSLEMLAGAIRAGSGRPVHVATSLEAVVPALLSIVRPGDVVITLGAGSIGSLPTPLLEALAHKGAAPS
jgi:UDP-N-acetylmuramate--alanine ligase